MNSIGAMTSHNYVNVRMCLCCCSIHEITINAGGWSSLLYSPSKGNVSEVKESLLSAAIIHSTNNSTGIE